MTDKTLTRKTVMTEIARILLEAEIERQRKLVEKNEAAAREGLELAGPEGGNDDP